MFFKCRYAAAVAVADATPNCPKCFGLIWICYPWCDLVHSITSNGNNVRWGVLRSFQLSSPSSHHLSIPYRFARLATISILSSVSHSLNSWPTRPRSRTFRHNFFEINCSRENMNTLRMAHTHTHCSRTLRSDKKHVQVCSFFCVLHHSSHVNLLMPEYQYGHSALSPSFSLARSLVHLLLFAIL